MARVWRWRPDGVARVSRWCGEGVAMVSRWCVEGVAMVSRRCGEGLAWGRPRACSLIHGLGPLFGYKLLLKELLTVKAPLTVIDGKWPGFSGFALLGLPGLSHL